MGEAPPHGPHAFSSLLSFFARALPNLFAQELQSGFFAFVRLCPLLQPSVCESSASLVEVARRHALPL